MRADFHLIETMRYENGTLRHATEHLNRLKRSALFFGFAFDARRIAGTLNRELTGWGQARVRVRYSRSGDIGIDIGHLPSKHAGPVRLAICTEPVNSSSIWLRHKTSRREAYDVRLAQHPEADDVVIVNDRGEVTETCKANIAILIGHVWWTPPLICGCLPGIERQQLKDARLLLERVVTYQDLMNAQSIAVMSSLQGWREALIERRSTATNTLSQVVRYPSPIIVPREHHDHGPVHSTVVTAEPPSSPERVAAHPVELRLSRPNHDVSCD